MKLSTPYRKGASVHCTVTALRASWRSSLLRRPVSEPHQQARDVSGVIHGGLVISRKFSEFVPNLLDYDVTGSRKKRVTSCWLF